MKGMAYHGWKLGLPDKFWPVTLDNFFDDPDQIRELGLSMMESKRGFDGNGTWPGYQSECLWKDGTGGHGGRGEGLSKKITEKILSCYFNLDVEKVFWDYRDIRFNSIPSLDKDKNSIKNKGWIHRDGLDPLNLHTPDTKGPQPELAGLIYLTPDIEKDTGTSLFNRKKDKTLDDYNETISARQPLFKGEPVNDEEIKEKWERHRSCFIEKVRFENIYNRLIMYDSKEWHAANNYYTPKDDRFHLGFFIGGIHANRWPLERVKQIKC